MEVKLLSKGPFSKAMNYELSPPYWCFLQQERPYKSI